MRRKNAGVPVRYLFFKSCEEEAFIVGQVVLEGTDDFTETIYGGNSSGVCASSCDIAAGGGACVCDLSDLGSGTSGLLVVGGGTCGLAISGGRAPCDGLVSLSICGSLANLRNVSKIGHCVGGVAGGAFLARILSCFFSLSN